MKNLKVASITLALLFALVSLASAHEAVTNTTKIGDKRVIYITLLQALENPKLVTDMRSQLDEGFLKNNLPAYTQEVMSQGYIFMITGTHMQWYLFFRAIKISHKKINKSPVNKKF